MRRNQDDKQMRTVNVAICVGLCLLALSGGIVWYTANSSMDTARRRQLQAQSMQEQESAHATYSKTPTLDETKLERDKLSNDPGETPEADATTPSTTPDTPPDTPPQAPAAQPTAPVFGYPLEADGEVVMSYSVDNAIYDPTLELYRTNASVSIAADTGDGVTAVESGVVKEIKDDDEKGKTIVLEHKNSWLTTYSQLAEDISVAQGQTVEKGQLLGTIAEPSRYSVALGSHLEFSMAKDGASVNPLDEINQ